MIAFTVYLHGEETDHPTFNTLVIKQDPDNPTAEPRVVAMTAHPERVPVGCGHPMCILHAAVEGYAYWLAQNPPA